MDAQAQELLRLIEAVDPSDIDALHVIDNKFYLYADDNRVNVNGLWIVKPYTRSRDALKSKRPDGWHCFTSLMIPSGKFVGYAYRDYEEMIESLPFLPTEELAELHVLVQAIAHERSQK